jgi:hypothetical protein
MLKPAFVAAFILVAGCDRAVVLESPLPDIKLTATATPPAGSFTNPVTITARAVNIGSSPVTCGAGCSFIGPGMTFQIVAPDSTEVFVFDPRTRPLCPDYILTIPPREEVMGLIIFDGNLFASNGGRLVPQEGLYSVIVSFRSFSGRVNDEGIVIKNRVTFRWSSQ